MANDQISVHVRDLVSTVFSGTAYAVSSINEKGPFDVLPMHANFISIVKEKIIIHQKNGQQQELKIDTGVLKNKDNIITIFLGIETLAQ